MHGERRRENPMDFSRNTEREEAMWMTRHTWKDNNKNGYSRSRM
jgi:hypothetical protein